MKKLNAKNKKLEKICINLNINGFFLKRDFFKRKNYQKKKKRKKKWPSKPSHRLVYLERAHSYPCFFKKNTILVDDISPTLIIFEKQIQMTHHLVSLYFGHYGG